MSKWSLIPIGAAIILLILLMNFQPPKDHPDDPLIVSIPAEETVVSAALVVTEEPDPRPALQQEEGTDPEPERQQDPVQVNDLDKQEKDYENEETGAEEEYPEVQEDIQIQEDITAESLDDTSDDCVDEISECDITSNGEFLGTWTITAYCGCPECCGSWSGSPTASGAWPTEGWTVACGSLPFGSIVYIEGLGEYCVEDRGVDGEWIDIYFDDHGAADAFGMQSLEVYLVGA